MAADPSLSIEECEEIENESFSIALYLEEEEDEEVDEDDIDMDTLADSLPPESDEPYTYIMWLDEGIEGIIGEDKFDQLESLFSTVEGIEDISHEDREIFYILAPTLTPRQVSERLRAAYETLRDAA